MPKPIIEVENLSKLYRLGVIGSTTLRDSLERWWYRRLGEEDKVQRIGSKHLMIEPDDPQAGPEHNTVWALKDVSFSVEKGEVLGIIGKNGAGKSTLLKILSRITEPTKGKAVIRGRHASLLEVGTGFHPELTGRDNVYLNGAILGMRKAEISRKFHEIVAFAEIEKFIDTPVKRYSSGMYVRLAFAVAAYLEPEILIVDEVLAVGDMAFQKKCLGKMGDVAKKGRTVLFVSHNMAAVSTLCNRAILLFQGKKTEDGATNQVISKYIDVGKEREGAERIWHDLRSAPGNERVRITAVRIISDGAVTADVEIQNDIHIEVEYQNLIPGSLLHAGIALLDQFGTVVLVGGNLPSINLIADEWDGKPYPVGRYKSVCIIPGNFLNDGRYSINAGVSVNVTKVEVYITEVASFNVHDTGAMRKEYLGGWPGVVKPKLAWKTTHMQV